MRYLGKRRLETLIQLDRSSKENVIKSILQVAKLGTGEFGWE